MTSEYSCTFAQGSQLAGSNNRIGPEGAPLTLLDSISEFLNIQRASLRVEAQEMQAVWRSTDAGMDPLMLLGAKHEH